MAIRKLIFHNFFNLKRWYNKMKIFSLFLSALVLTITSTHASEVLHTEEAQQFQQEFDETYFEINEGFEKLRHTLLHLMKTTGKIATYCEAKEHGKEPDTSQLLNEAIPDLLIYTLQMANLYNIDLGEKYDGRIELLKERSIQQKKNAIATQIQTAAPQ